MNYYTQDCYEIKRESVKFAKFLTKNSNKTTQGFIMDMIYGIGAAKDLKISNIARTLKEQIKLKNTVERICLNLDKEIDNKKGIEEQYRNYVRPLIPEYPKVIFDLTDIVKIYGKEFEYIDKVHDGSDMKKRIKPGYMVANAVVVGERKNQPIPIYSKIISTNDPEFKSVNAYTMESIDKAYEIVGGRYLGIFDRGYDDKKLFRYMDKK